MPPDADGALFTAEELLRFASAAGDAAGLDPPDAEILAAALVEADLRGVHSHGVKNLPMYLHGVVQGNVAASVTCPVVVDTGAFVLLDGENGLGHITCTRAMDLAIDRARLHGVAFVGVQNSNHCGAAAFYAERAVAQDQLGFCTTNSPAVMAPWGGREARLGSNPVSYGIPAGEAPAIVLDMACTVALRDAFRARRKSGTPLPLGWALDSSGEPTTDPDAALAGAVLPFGEHKGYGLGVVNEVLSAALTGALFSFEIANRVEGKFGLGGPAQESWDCGHLIGAFDVGKIIAIEEFKRRIDHLVASLKSAGGEDEAHRVYMPGEIEHYRRLERLADGVPLPEDTSMQLASLAAELGVEAPTRDRFN
jgi:LDH2 family malate/lactate/ureidoglycolate dehydrogenase